MNAGGPGGAGGAVVALLANDVVRVNGLVSADGEIVARARALNQACLSPRAFWTGVRDASAVDLEAVERERTLPRSEVEHWLEIFGGENLVQKEQARAKRRAEQAKPKPVMPPEEVKDWLRYFGEDA